jgi:hypothetical protein
MGLHVMLSPSLERREKWRLDRDPQTTLEILAGSEILSSFSNG